MTIDRSLYIITKQVKQDAKHRVSIKYVGFNPREVNHTFGGSLCDSSTFLIHRVKLNDMGAKDVEIITYQTLVEDARTYRELVFEENPKEAGIRPSTRMAIPPYLR